MSDIVFGLMVTGIGMAVIFAILGLLILFIYGFSYLLNIKNKKALKSAEGKLDTKAVAAITACITYFYETERKQEEKRIDFIVKSIKRR